MKREVVQQVMVMEMVMDLVLQVVQEEAVLEGESSLQGLTLQYIQYR